MCHYVHPPLDLGDSYQQYTCTCFPGYVRSNNTCEGEFLKKICIHFKYSNKLFY